MRRFAFVFAMAAALAMTMNSAQAKVVDISPSYAYPGCFEVRATQGWQRLNLSSRRDVTSFIIDGDNVGWTVDKNRYGRVGKQGHTGRDAASLKPYDKFKYDRRFPFGALLARGLNGNVVHLNFKRLTMKAGELKEIQFRINDSDRSLQDNAGYLFVCPRVSRRK